MAIILRGAKVMCWMCRFQMITCKEDSLGDWGKVQQARGYWLEGKGKGKIKGQLISVRVRHILLGIKK